MNKCGFEIERKVSIVDEVEEKNLIQFFNYAAQGMNEEQTQR